MPARMAVDHRRRLRSELLLRGKVLADRAARARRRLAAERLLRGMMVLRFSEARGGCESLAR